MTTRSWIVSLLVLCVMLSPACGRRKQAPIATFDPSESVVPEPRQVSVPLERPATESDPLSGDLAAVNRYVREADLLGDVHFGYDLYELTMDARARLDQNARFLKQHAEFIVTVEGHCDERGTNEYNIALGQARARAAVEYLSRAGVETACLHAVGYGEERPVCRESEEACWSRNRRAHFVITARR